MKTTLKKKQNKHKVINQTRSMRKGCIKSTVHTPHPHR